MPTIEELQEQLLQEQEAKKLLQTKNDELQAKNDELTKTNAQLTDYNNKLFMRVTAEKEKDETNQDESEQDAEQKEIENIRKLMKDRRN